MSVFPFDYSLDSPFEVVKTFMGDGEKSLSSPDLIFFGVRHSSSSESIPSFIRSLQGREKYQIIFETAKGEEINQKNWPFLDRLPVEMKKKGWDDPDHKRYADRVKELFHYISVIDEYPKQHSKDDFFYACEMLRPIYDDYTKKLSWQDRLKFSKKPDFPNKEKQSYENFLKSIDYLKSIVNQIKERICTEEYLIRQKKLCESIEEESVTGSPAIWIAGASHFSKKIANEHPIKEDREALKLFKEAVRKTGKSAVVVLAVKPYMRHTY